MKVSINRIQQRVLSVALSFRGKFTTEDFISRFAQNFPRHGVGWWSPTDGLARTRVSNTPPHLA